MRVFPPSSAEVTIVTAVNATFQEAFQFDDEDDVSWDFNNKLFAMSLKNTYEDAAALVTFSGGQIVVDDNTRRILHFNVPRETLAAAGVIPGCYYHDLLMTDGVNAVVTPLMHGDFIVTDGITGVT